MHGVVRSNFLESAPDIDALSSFPSLEDPDQIQNVTQTPPIAPHSPSTLGSFSNVAEHGFAAASFIPENMPDLNGDFELPAQREPPASTVWGLEPAAASKSQFNGTSILRASSWPSAINTSDREVEAGDIAPPSLSDFLTFKGKSKQDKKQKKGKKNKNRNNSMLEYDM